MLRSRSRNDGRYLWRGGLERLRDWLAYERSRIELVPMPRFMLSASDVDTGPWFMCTDAMPCRRGSHVIGTLVIR